MAELELDGKLLVAMPGMGDPRSLGRIGLKSLLYTVCVSAVAVLIGLVLGTIYAGWATPTESAALGVAGAIVLALVDRKLTWKMMAESMTATARTTSMIALILLGAYLLNYILSSLGVPQMLAKFLTGLPLADWGIMLVIIGFYLALGTFMEGMSMVITTIPLLFPVVKALGYDPIWFGVIKIVTAEVGLILPPIGLNCFVVARYSGLPVGEVAPCPPHVVLEPNWKVAA